MPRHISQGGTNGQDLDELNENIEIPAEVYAEVKPLTQATAGPIYKCQAPTSKMVEIAGG